MDSAYPTSNSNLGSNVEERTTRPSFSESGNTSTRQILKSLEQQEGLCPRNSRMEDCNFSLDVCPYNPNKCSNRRQSYNDTTVDDAWMNKDFSCDSGSFLAHDLQSRQIGNMDRNNVYSSDTASFTSYGENGSLAKMDSLALREDDATALDDSMIVEHLLPDHAGRNRRRRRCLCVTSCFLMMGVVAMTAVLAALFGDGSTSSRNVNVNDGSESSSLSDNIFAIGGELPDLYYMLEPKVYNASALLDSDTVEGKAFHATVMQESSISYNDATGASAKGLDLIQRYALMTMYFGSDGGAWSIQDGWNGEGNVCSEWYGITCQNSVVTGINLGGNNLHGSIPADFCLLNFLEILALSDSGGIVLPTCSSQLLHLEEVYLDGNGYEGPLPIMFHQFPSLSYLNLANNGYTGSLRSLFPPNGADANSFSSLKTLILNDNELTGDIPQSNLRRVRNLERLEVMGNPQLSGSMNEICKGTLMFAEADCDKVSCRCCQKGTSCPSF